MPTSQKKASSKRSGAVRDISIKKVKQDDAFKVHRIHDERADTASVEPLIENQSMNDTENMLEEADEIEEEVEEVLANVAKNQEREQSLDDVEPRDFVKVKFAKFVQLVSTRDCADVVNANLDEDVVMSSNLLTELAGAHDEREEKKIPLVFLVGLAIGVVLTYILIMK